MANDAATSSASGGIGFVGLLTIVFIVLKLTGHITWSWVWVLSPFWISALLTGVVLLLVVMGALATVLLVALRDHKKVRRG